MLSIDNLKDDGFVGFLTIKKLRDRKFRGVSESKGVYLVLNPQDVIPEYLPKGSGGFHKMKDPNVKISILQSRWIENTPILYIGKAGGGASSASIKSRLKQYLDFGQGGQSHYGGRHIWQLRHSEELIVCWKDLHDIEPLKYERYMINDFKATYGFKPFANIN